MLSTPMAALAGAGLKSGVCEFVCLQVMWPLVKPNGCKDVSMDAVGRLHTEERLSSSSLFALERQRAHVGRS